MKTARARQHSQKLHHAVCRAASSYPVISSVSFAAHTGECVVLGRILLGAGKSSILKMIFGSYRCDRGQIVVHHGRGAHRHRSGHPAAGLALLLGHHPVT